MIYTEEDLEQAYAIGYNEAVDDVNEYIDQESMEFSLDESYDEDYSAVEDMICNETKAWKKKEHTDAIMRRRDALQKKYGKAEFHNAGYGGINRRIEKNKNSKDFNDAVAIDKAIHRKNNNNTIMMSKYLHPQSSSKEKVTDSDRRMKEIGERIRQMNERRKNKGLAIRGRR